MTLQEYLKQINQSEDEIISYSQEGAMAAVQQNGHALQYVDKRVFDQTINIKITVELNGKKVPFNSLSDETIETLKKI